MARTSASRLAKSFLSEGCGVAAACMAYATCVVCSIGCLVFFGPGYVEVEPRVQAFKSDLDTETLS